MKNLFAFYILLYFVINISNSLTISNEFIKLKESPIYKDMINDVQWDLLYELSERFIDWNDKINLVSRKDIENYIPNHLLPSLAINKIKTFYDNEKIIDIGTGGGLPGLPLAILNPNSEFTLLDSNKKKMVVVEDLTKSLKLNNVKIKNVRAETIIDDKYDYLLGRAVSAIPKFLSFSSHLLKDFNNNNYDDLSISHSGLLYIKGGDFKDELLEANIKEENTLKFPIKDLVNIDTDKFILHIPAKEIINFRNRNKLNYNSGHGLKDKKRRTKKNNGQFKCNES